MYQVLEQRLGRAGRREGRCRARGGLCALLRGLRSFLCFVISPVFVQVKGKNLLDCGCDTTTADFVWVFGEGEDFGERVFQGGGRVEWVGRARCEEEVTASRGLYSDVRCHISEDVLVGVRR